MRLLLFANSVGKDFSLQPFWFSRPISPMKKSLLYMNMAVFLWGFTGVLGRAITLSALSLVWWRVALTAAILALILTFTNSWTRICGKDGFRVGMVGGLMAIHWVAFYGSIKLANASVALICLSTAPVFVALLAPLARQARFNMGEVLLGLLALSGVYLIYRTQMNFGAGILWGVVAAVLSAIFTVLNKPLAVRYPPRSVVFWEMTAGAALLSGILLFFPGLLGDRPFWPQQAAYAPGESLGHFLARPNDWLWLFCLSLFCTVWAQNLALRGLKNLSSFTTTLLVNMEPIYGIALAFLFFRESSELSAGFYGGVGLILLSVALQVLRVVRLARQPESI